MIEQLRHPWSTQAKEVMKKSVAAYAPKGKTYPLTNSLDTRVCIAGSIQILGYLTFWTRIFHELHIDMNPNLRKHIQSKDEVKKKKSVKKRVRKVRKCGGEEIRETEQGAQGVDRTTEDMRGVSIRDRGGGGVSKEKLT